MAERYEPPDLAYEYKCLTCEHTWSRLSRETVGLECPSCQSKKIRLPKEYGTYKYNCPKCEQKWKKKNSRGGSGFCPFCPNPPPIYPYKFTPAPPKRMFGHFRCETCNRSWASGYAFEGWGQECQVCGANILPHNLRPLRRRRNPFEQQKPHKAELCERCKKGFPCRQAEAAADDEDGESVISMSDSSLASESRSPDDTTPVPSEDGADICGDIDELTEEIEKLELPKR